jgi:tripartite-type tricarboxylate transporter receptor subunit TctC
LRLRPACALPLPGRRTYPVKPVRYVVPFPAGTGNDIVGRLLADRLTRLWGQQVIVDNRAGASGAIGAAFVAEAPPDGYTLLHCNIVPSADKSSTPDLCADQPICISVYSNIRGQYIAKIPA